MSNLLTSDKQYIQNAIQVGLNIGFQYNEVLDNLGIDINCPEYNGQSIADKLFNFVRLGDNEIVGKLLLELSGHFRNRELAGHIYKRGFSEDIEKIGNRLLAIPKQQAISQPMLISIDNNLISIEICPEIYKHIKRYLDVGDYFNAVSEAYKVVREKLKTITTKEKAIEVFNPNAESSKYHERLFGHVAEAGSPESDFFRGIGYLHLAVQFLRNEKAHILAHELDKNLAIHYLSLASLAYDLIGLESSDTLC